MDGVSKHSFKYFFYIFIILQSALLGGLVFFFPVSTLIFLGLIYFLIWLFIKPKRIPLFLLLTASTTITIIFSSNILGMDANALYKLLTILIMLIAIKYYGANLSNGLCLVAVFMLLVLTYTFSDFHPRMNALDPMISFFGLVSYFLILVVQWEEKMSKKIIVAIVFLPLISVCIGLVLDTLGIHSFINEDYYGGTRWQGANIGPHLAMLAFLGLCVSLIELKRSNHKKLLFFCMAATNFFILLSTGTRGPLLACVFILIAYIADHLKEFMKGKIFVIVPLTLFVITLSIFLTNQWDNIMLRTFNDNNGELGVNFSGREVAWEYFMSHARGYEMFGQGLGAVLVANDGSLYKGFTVPHNEYIRFYFDNGIVGLLLLFGSLMFVLIKLGVRLQKKIRIYYFSFILGFLLYSFVDNTLSTIQFIVPFCFYISALSSLYMNNRTLKI